MIPHHSTYARIFPGNHHLEVLLFLWRIIGCIGVETAEHSMDTLLHHLTGIECIYIHQVERSIESIKDIKVFCHLKIMVFRLLRNYWSHQEAHKDCYQQDSFLHFFSFFVLFSLQNYSILE